ncbi:MAG: ABC transporter permease subunit [Anaerolineales bacterium]|uniref:ABC transporter permease n=1 Tax=Candidatus Villigracilis proximus TaxID=3140683 RepID=UPI003134B932|nr:ABC transporter permease subunit [Anaerolineales bacterium]
MNMIWIIARMTFLEAVRRRIAMAGLVLGLIFLIAFTLGFRAIYIHSYASLKMTNDVYRNLISNESINVLLLTGLYAVTFLSAAMGALLGADTLSGDIISGTIQTIVSKPINRSEVVLGKWLGYSILLALYSLLMSGGVVFSVWIQSGYLAQNLLPGLSLIYLESLLILTIAITCSSFLPGLAAGSVVFGLYGLAFIGGWVEQIGAVMQNEAAVQFGIMISLFIPSEALWRRAAFEMQTPISAVLHISPFGTLSIPSPLMVEYALLYLVLSLLKALNIFKKRDL